MSSDKEVTQGLEKSVQGSTLMATVRWDSQFSQQRIFDTLGFSDNGCLADKFRDGVKLLNFEFFSNEKGVAYAKYTVQFTREFLLRPAFAWLLFCLSTAGKKNYPSEGLTLRVTLTPWRFVKFSEWLDGKPSLAARIKDLGEEPISRDFKRSKWVWLADAKLKK